MTAGANKGERRGGRTKGTLNQRTIQRKEIVDKALEQGVTPVEIMIDNMRWAHGLALKAADAKDEKNEKAYRTLSQQWAEDCANYFFPKMASVEHTGEDGGPIQINSETELARRALFLLAKLATNTTGDT